MKNAVESFKDFIFERFDQKPIFLKPDIFYFQEKGLAFLFQVLDEIENLDPNFLKDFIENFRFKNIHLIIIWEDQWISKRPIVESRISALFGQNIQIHGRKTIVQRIDRAQSLAFLQENHLQGSTSSKFRFGLYYNGEIVAVATFSAGRKMTRINEKHISYELIRFANKLGKRVYGGFDKLLNAFIQSQKPTDIMTYADTEWSDGTSYSKLGFVEKGKIDPTPFYINRLTFERISEKKYELLAHKENYIKIFNAGSLKYLKMI